MASERTLLVTGGTGFVGSHFVYRLLQNGTGVVALVRGSSAVMARERLLLTLAKVAASYCEPFDREQASLRLHVVCGDVGARGCALTRSDRDILAGVVDEIWHLAANLQFETRNETAVRAQNVDGTSHAIDLALELKSARFVYVSTAYVAGRQRGLIPEGPARSDVEYNNAYEASKAEAERVVCARCEAAALDYRVLRPSIVVAPSTTKSTGGSTTGLYGFIRELRKSRQFLDREGVQITAPADPEVRINLVPIDAVISEMIDLHRNGFDERRYYHLVNPDPPTARELMEVTCRVVEINQVRLVSDHVPTTPIERLLARRFEFYNSYFRDSKLFACSGTPSAVVTASDIQFYMREALRETEGSPIDAILKRSVLRTRDGMTVTSFRGGKEGAPVVAIVNAYGMPGDFIAPLSSHLGQNFQIISWESRGVPGLSGNLSGFNAGPEAHANDLVDLLAMYGLRGPVHLVAWCSGVHVAHLFARRYPRQVASLCLLNGSYFMDGLPLTDFQRSVTTVMPRIAQNIEYARLYHAVAYGKGASARGESAQLDQLMDGIDPSIVSMTSLPFQTPESLFRYATMLDQLLRNGEERWAGSCAHPCLVLTGRKDQVAHFEGSLDFARRYGTPYVTVMEEGDHYSLFFDREVAERVSSFVAETAVSGHASPGGFAGATHSERGQQPTTGQRPPSP